MLQGMFCLDPRKRLTCHEALESSFWTSQPPPAPRDKLIPPGILKSDQ